MHEIDRAQLAGFLAEVVQVESPVHWKEAARRVMAGAGVQKMGSRIEKAFEEAVRLGVGRRMYIQRGDFLWRADMERPPVRDRSDLPAASRKLDLIAPEEIRAGILQVIRQSCGMSFDEAPGAVCRLLGFARVTDDMRGAMELHRDALIKRGDLRANGQNLTVVAPETA
jgi:hypothetical protein